MWSKKKKEDSITNSERRVESRTVTSSYIATTSLAVPSTSTRLQPIQSDPFQRNIVTRSTVPTNALALSARRSTIDNDAYPFRPSTIRNTPRYRPTSTYTSELSIPQQNASKEKSIKKRTVKKTGVKHDTTNSPVPIYSTSTKGKRGKLLIINNQKFAEKKYRNGAQLDEDSLKKLFIDMNFEVKIKNDLTLKDMEESLKSFSKKDFSKNDICVVVVMSHGNINVGLTEILTLDEKTINTETILKYFSAENAHRSLLYKPKIFFFQCCRGDGKDELKIQTDGQIISARHFADMLIAHSTVPGYASHRDPKLGTWYIQTICDVFSEHAHEFDVETMLKIVDSKLEQYNFTSRQTSSYECRGFKKCYFHP